MLVSQRSRSWLYSVLQKCGDGWRFVSSQTVRDQAAAKSRAMQCRHIVRIVDDAFACGCKASVGIAILGTRDLDAVFQHMNGLRDDLSSVVIRSFFKEVGRIKDNSDAIAAHRVDQATGSVGRVDDVRELGLDADHNVVSVGDADQQSEFLHHLGPCGNTVIIRMMTPLILRIAATGTYG